jgi:hypothetical protein
VLPGLPHRRLIAGSLGALALSACGGDEERPLEVAYDGECLVEVDFVREATQREVDAFVRRVEGIEHVDRVQVLSRAGNIARFREGILAEGYSGEEYDRLMARARRQAGRTLLVKADDDRNVQSIIGALRILPGSVSAVHERDTCL